MMTDEINGFLIDHGFHVMQTGYPTSQRAFDFEKLGAKAFEPGAVVVQKEDEDEILAFVRPVSSANPRSSWRIKWFCVTV